MTNDAFVETMCRLGGTIWLNRDILCVHMETNRTHGDMMHGHGIYLRLRVHIIDLRKKTFDSPKSISSHPRKDLTLERNVESSKKIFDSRKKCRVVRRRFCRGENPFGVEESFSAVGETFSEIGKGFSESGIFFRRSEKVFRSSEFLFRRSEIFFPRSEKAFFGGREFFFGVRKSFSEVGIYFSEVGKSFSGSENLFRK